MWWELLTDLVGPMLFGALITVSVYESVRFYRRPPQIVIVPKPRWVVRRTPAPPPLGHLVALRIPEQRRRGA